MAISAPSHPEDSVISKARCVGESVVARDSCALVYEATYHAKYEGGHGLERMREVRISVCFARETVQEIAPWKFLRPDGG